MAKIKLVLLDDEGKILQERVQKVELGGGSFNEIEQAVEDYQQKEMKELTKILLEEEQKKFISTTKKIKE